jgi:hypothetical protein
VSDSRSSHSILLVVVTVVKIVARKEAPEAGEASVCGGCDCFHIIYWDQESAAKWVEGKGAYPECR